MEHGDVSRAGTLAGGRCEAARNHLSGLIAERCAALAALFSFREREQRRQREQLRRTYADLISRLIDPAGDEQGQRELVKRLLLIDLSELQKLHTECLQVAEERTRSRRRDKQSAPSRDALWDLTPLLK
jgi:hypothetical protein